MIVTIDGPAGAGKSSIARALANKLKFQFLDTGAMYRAVSWAALHDCVSLEEAAGVADVARRIEIRFGGDSVLVDGVDVTSAIRTSRVTESVKHVASNEAVRRILIEQQRQIGADAANLVTEGRDQGTVVFPQAECKIFLTATPEERAKRRYRELLGNGEVVTFAEVLQRQNLRDASDAARSFAPLTKPDDAIEVYTDDMTPEQVLDHLVWVVDSSRPEETDTSL